jgi:hypothetical protein
MKSSEGIYHTKPTGHRVSRPFDRWLRGAGFGRSRDFNGEMGT